MTQEGNNKLTVQLEGAQTMELDESQARDLVVRNRQLERQLLDSEVERVISEASTRGVPPAVTNRVKAIMLACDPAGEGLIELEGTSNKVNVFGAMKELLTQIPIIELETETTEGAESEKPEHLESEEEKDKKDPTKALEEATTAAEAMWKDSGIGASATPVEL